MYKIINRKKLVATAIVDRLGKIFFYPLHIFRKQVRIKPETVKKICIIRTAYIGDVVMTLPMLPPLKQKFPDATVTFLTSTASAPLLQHNPHIDEILTFDPFWFYPTRKKNWLVFTRKLLTLCFDLVIETRADIRELALIAFWIQAKYIVSYDVGGGGYLLTHIVPYPGFCHKVDYHLNILEYLGASTQGADAKIYITDAEYDTVSLLLKNKGVNGPFIAVHPGSRLVLKRWYPDRFAQLCDILTNRYKMPVVLLGARQEQPLVAKIQTLAQHRIITINGELELRQLTAVLALARVFICNDSAPMHIAAAMNTPTVAIFGPSKSVETAPYGVLCEVVEKEFPCRYSCDESSCRYAEHHACLKQVKVHDVLDAVERILEK